jgi:hypothetical protein
MILDHQQDPAAAAAAATSSKERSTQQHAQKRKGKTKQRRVAGDNTYMQKLKPSFVLPFSSVINKSQGKQKGNKKNFKDMHKTAPKKSCRCRQLRRYQ